MTCLVLSWLAVQWWLPTHTHAATRRADLVLQTGGGHGAVRELCDLLLEDRRVYEPRN